MSSSIGKKNHQNYITLENGWIIPEYKKDIIDISNDYNEIYIYDCNVPMLSAGIPIFSKNKLNLIPGAIMTILPDSEFINKFSVSIRNDGLLKKLFNDLKVREDLQNVFLNPKFVNGIEQRFFDGLDGEYEIRDIKISLNKNHQYVGFNIN
ncbi:MAG: hypothetical protein PF569_00070 [Candidatus Woesearchaeota archaeon]|jgi:hypothetical protein|nr:hypothetical protein [Candidatus Woesearchaeota archaeon]